MTVEYECPHCKADLRNGEIPEKDREAFGNKKYFSRLIGIEILGGYDGIQYWKCPECKVVWDRFTGKIQKDFDKDDSVDR